MVCHVVVPVPPLAEESAEPRESEPREAAELNRLVEEAVVVKKFVLVAFVIVTLPVAPTENKFVPELLRIWKRFAA